jgi:hypothetical protein
VTAPDRRHTADSITDDALTALYDERDRLDAEVTDAGDAIRRLSNRLHARTINDDPELASQAAALLLAAAPDSEVRRLVRAAVRAGWMFRCDDCREARYANESRCRCAALPAHDTQETTHG